jgi:hypothetical protein
VTAFVLGLRQMYVTFIIVSTAFLDWITDSTAFRSANFFWGWLFLMASLSARQCLLASRALKKKGRALAQFVG